MMRLRRLLPTLAAATLLAFTGTVVATADAQTTSGVADLNWLTGGTWIGSAPGSPLQVRTAYSWSNNHQFVRFFTKFVMPTGTQNKYDGNIYFDPATKQAMTWYIHENGAITSAATTISDSGFSMTFADTDEDGKPANYRVEVTRQSADRYVWRLFQQTATGWQAALTLAFVRQT
jgi:hypothetical protein